MRKAYHKDIWRSITKNRKRFFSIMIITALGVGMLTGLNAACLDMYYSADKYYDQQNLFDIRVLSTLGLTQEDVEALSSVDGVKAAEGGYLETVHTDVNDMQKSAEMTILSRQGLNMPYLLAGSLPTKKGEIAVTEKYLAESNKSIGEILTIEEDSKTAYTITGAVLNPLNIQSDGTGSAFRSTSTTDYSFFISETDTNNNVYSVIYLTLAGTQEMNCFSLEYETKVQSIIDSIEKDLKATRQQARYDSVLLESRKEIESAENAILEELAGAAGRFPNAGQDFAKEKMAEAYAELDEIKMARWYVQDRASLESYSSLKSDLSSIEAVGKGFPLIFLLVAVLMSLTTMTRMVEEERGLIGSYKAIGFKNIAIYQKYLLFAFIACFLGGILGDLFGFIFMPRFLAIILEALYTLPKFYLRFDILHGLGGILLFMLAIMGATAHACRSELKQMPASLLRPKAPPPGSRVFLEYIPIIWNRLQFLDKLTIRNLFRYKKRLLMTVSGIMGCTALVLCGFAIKDSVADLAPKQYEVIYRYDLMAVFDEADNDDLNSQLAADNKVEDFLSLRIEGIKLINSAKNEEKVQLLVIPQGKAIEDYIHLESLDAGPIRLDEDGVIITQNASRILDLQKGDTVSLQNIDLVQHEVEVSAITMNYLGNNVYMTQKLFESSFGNYAPNGVLAHLSVSYSDHSAYAEELLNNDSVLSAVSTAALQDEFGFDLINAVVLLLIVMAGGLAFVVLFTLSNTNISERARELATIKVLGFYDKELYQYVNKETLTLTVMGILLGLPAGRLASDFLIAALNMPSIHFAVHIEPFSYLASAAITFFFAIVVAWMTNRTLDGINMVEALKSVE